ncbi:glycosyltransferase family 61 protein [Candidatus Dependentiae bacterium]|nr:glycosyltransferase family 61 protein [Candidatus Dependentiae bacterium]
MKKIIIIIFTFFYYNNSFSIQSCSLYQILKAHPEITYIPCQQIHSFSYPIFPLSVHPYWQPNIGTFAETFILKIPQGKVFSRLGFVEIESMIIKDLFSQNYSIQNHEKWMQQCYPEKNVKKIKGRVIVITRIDHDCYGHWLAELLTRLLMIHEQNITYDWIYTPYDRPYIKESLALLGIDQQKIIEPFHQNYYIQADELIVPSLTARQIPSSPSSLFTGYYPATFYCPNWAMSLLRQTFLPKIQSIAKHFNAPKIFISRKDSHQRRMINEDEIFSLFEQKGFQRFCMSDLSFAQQLALFYQARYIVAAHGSALTNLIFCQPKTKVIEIFQNQFDNGFWQLSQQLGLQHFCIKTQEQQLGSWKIDTMISPQLIKAFINSIHWDEN